MEVSQTELRTFSGQFADLLIGDSGNILTYLETLAAQQTNERLKTTTVEMRQGIAEGTSLRFIMQAHPDVFSRDFVEGFNQGEAAGALDVFLKQYADGIWDSRTDLTAYGTREPRTCKLSRPA